jgi:hypothetical protein
VPTQVLHAVCAPLVSWNNPVLQGVHTGVVAPVHCPLRKDPAPQELVHALHVSWLPGVS